MVQRGSTAVLDGVPEEFPYRDDGCEISPSCLRCPLPMCKYDDPVWFQREKRRERDEEVLSAMRMQNLTVPEAAARFDISQRTIFRILQRCGFKDVQAVPAA